MCHCVALGFRRLSLGLGCAFILVGAAFAGPEDDYNQGMTRYRKGDIVESMLPLQKAADAGHAAAQAMYGYLLDISDFDDQAVVYYKKSADQGNPDGQYGYGVALLNGEGIAKDPAEAEKWIRKAADAGLEGAINQMALIFLARNDPAMQEEALNWINKSVESNFVPAIQGLALAYREGKLGLPVDVKRADELTQKANKLLGLDKRKRRGVKK